MRRNKSSKPCITNRYPSVDNDLGCINAAITKAQIIAACHKSRLIEFMRAHDQASCINVCVFTKNHAIAVDQYHAAIGLNGPQNARRISAKNAVGSDGLCAWLTEHHGLIVGNREAIPVDDSPVCCLRNRYIAASVTRYRCLPGNDIAT